MSVRRSLADLPSFSWELPRERGPRHVAQARKLGQRPCARGLVEQSGHRRCQAGMPSQSKETAWRIFRLAGEPHHEREHGRRQRVQHGAAAETIVRGLTPHQGDEASELRGSFLLSSVSTGMHDQARWQIAAQQAIVRGRDREVSAQQIESFFRTEIFADREVEGRAVAGRQGRGPAAIVHDVPWAAGKQQNVAGLQL